MGTGGPSGGHMGTGGRAIRGTCGYRVISDS